MKINIGTRKSNLAQIQTYSVKNLLEKADPNLEISIIPISTKGDQIQDRPIEQINEKGVFVKEIERALLNEEIDIAVHSMKDMPSQIDERLTFVNPPVAQPPEDVFVGNSNLTKFEDLNGKIIGTGSNRRIAQLNYHLSNITIKPIRGNIETRMKKIKTENLDGTILARAGLIRGGYEDKIGFIFDPRILIPSPCQGILAIEVRKKDIQLIDFLNNLANPWASFRMEIERTFQSELQATCESPIGIYTKYNKKNKIVKLYGSYAENKNSKLVYYKTEGSFENRKELAKKLAKGLKEKI